MKILLKEDVTNLGYAGEVMDVADGYGRNYLIPQGLAVKATAGVLKEAEVWRQRAAVRVTEIRKEHEALSAEISNTNLVFYARAGETGKLYGSVTTADITDKLNEELGTDIDRRLITSQPLRQLGEHRVTIKLGRDFHPQVSVIIHPLEPEEAEELEETETEAEIEVDVSEELEVEESGEEEISDDNSFEDSQEDDSAEEDEDTAESSLEVEDEEETA